MSGNGFRYTGNGKRFRGVPARDLTQHEYDRLGPRERRSVIKSGAYEAIELADLKLDELKAMAVESGANADEVGRLNKKEGVIKVINSASAPPASKPSTDSQPNQSTEGKGGK